MQVRTNRLWDELSGLADAYAAMARPLHQAARQLQMPGALPEARLLESLEDLRARFRALRLSLRATADALGFEWPDAEEPSTLKDLAVLLEGITTVEERADRRAAQATAALAVLGRVMAMRHLTNPAFEPLTRCQEQAARLIAEIEQGAGALLDPVVEALAENDHPFAYLVLMAEGSDGVGDDLWESLYESVGREFGRPLAAAAARGKVALVRAIASSEPEPSSRAVAEPARIEEPDTTPLVVVLRQDAPVEPCRGPRVPESETPDPTSAARAIGSALAALTAEDVLTPVVEEALPFLPGGIAAILAARGRGRTVDRRATPRVERLETVRLLSCNVIAGHVFLDANNDGLYNAGDSPIANNLIELRNSIGVIVGTATTGPDGSYSFSTDGTISTAPVTQSHTIPIPAAPTNFSTPFSVPQFNPDLGELTDVEININGQLTSRIRAENLSTSSPATLTTRLIGDIRLTGPGLDLSATLNDLGGSFNAGIFDGTLDYDGPSGHDFGVQTAGIDQILNLSRANGDDLSAFIGSGNFTGALDARARSSATGGGNVDYETTSTAGALVTVVYRYTPTNCLAPGNYTLVQPNQPPGTLNGKRSSEGIVLPPVTSGPDTIPIVLTGQDLLSNDFGELIPSRLSGFVYVDANNNGVKETGESPISSVRLILTGTNDLGQAVNLTADTDALGAYQFTNLRPGTYRIVQSQPAGFLDGKDSVGSQGGTLGNDQIDAITIGQGVDGINNNFGELLPASLSGFVYHDASDDGVKDVGEAGIEGVLLTLTGTNDLGQPVSLTTTTDNLGAYAFNNLRPGTYRIVQSQPAGFLDGKDSVGSQGGTLGNDQIDAIALLQGIHGINNNFGEVLPGALNGYVYFDLNRNGIKDPGERGIANVEMRLTGLTSLGSVVPLTMRTDANGFYQFNGLRPGDYTVTQTSQPAGFLDGLESRGNVVPLPNTRGTDVIAEIIVVAGGLAPNNNFGEEVEPEVACEVITQIEDVTRIGIHHQPTRILIRFSNNVDPASATNLANYELVLVSRGGKVSRRPIPLRSAEYDPETRTVTLTTVRPINIHYLYRLRIDGVQEVCLAPIDGDGDGRHGGVFETTLSRANSPYAASASTLLAQKTSAWAARFPRLASERLGAGPRTRRA